MKAQISLHIYMGSMQCRPHIKEGSLVPRGERGKRENRSEWCTGGPNSEEIMKSWKDIKSEGNQGVKEERSIGHQKTLNEREMGSWDKEVQKTKGRSDSSKEIKDLLHFGFFFYLPSLQSLLSEKQTPATYSKWHQSGMSDLDKLGCQGKEDAFQTEERGCRQWGLYGGTKIQL